MSLILTLEIDSASQMHFNRLRELYFPPERNLIDAHITLFHNLPEIAEVVCELDEAATARSAFLVDVTGLRSLGKGVAYTLASPALQALHGSLAASFDAHLIPQDRQRFQPHIVVQNKVTPEAARALLGHLQTGFRSRRIKATGLSLWHYQGGPWEPARTFRFREAAEAAS